MAVQTWYKLTGHVLMEIGDGSRDPQDVCMHVYLSDDIVRCLERTPELAKVILSHSNACQLFQDCDFSSLHDLMESMALFSGDWAVANSLSFPGGPGGPGGPEIQQKVALPTSEQILAYAALNIAIHACMEDGLPADAPIMLRDSMLQLECGSTCHKGLFSILQALSEDDIGRLTHLVDAADLENLNSRLQRPCSVSQ